MNKGNFPVHQATHQNLIRITRSSRGSKDLSALLVCPPVGMDRLAGHFFGEIRSRSSTSLEHYSMLFNEFYWINQS